MSRKDDLRALKGVLLDSIALNDYCNKNGLSIDKLKKADIVKLPMMYAFTRPSGFVLPKDSVGLEYDIDTQHKPLLGVEVSEDSSVSIVPTEYTYELKI